MRSVIFSVGDNGFLCFFIEFVRGDVLTEVYGSVVIVDVLDLNRGRCCWVGGWRRRRGFFFFWGCGGGRDWREYFKVGGYVCNGR